MTPVLSQSEPVFLAIFPTLVKQPLQVRPLSHFIAVQRFVNPIAAHLIVVVPHRHHVDAVAWFQTDFPVVLRHTRNHMIVRQMPTGTDETVLHPHIRILLRKRNLRHGILHEDGGMGFAVDMHDLALIVYKVLQAQRRGNHLTRGAEVIELPTCQGQNGHFQGGYLIVGLRGVCAQGTAELRVEVVFFLTALYQQGNGLITEEPDTDIRQIEMILLKLSERLYRGFLEHLLQHRGRLAIADEHPVILRHRGIEPETIAHHIGIGNRLQGLGGPDEDIATDHHRMQALRRSSHHLLIQRQLHTHQVLREFLTPFPTEHRQRHQHLTRNGIAGQTLALSTSMDQDTFLLRKPRFKLLTPDF